MLVGTIVAGVAYYFQHNRSYETVNEDIGGKVPIKINSSDFDSHEIKGVEIHLPYNADYSSVTVYEYDGSCDDIKPQVTTLPSNSSFVLLNASIPQPVNYYNDTPIYALAGTTLSYQLSASKNVSQQGCVYLYFFNTSTSYEMFFNRSNSPYYNKSECIILSNSSNPSPRNHTILLSEEDTFLYSGIVAILLT